MFHTCQALTAAGNMNRNLEERRVRAAETAVRQKRKRFFWMAVGWVFILVCSGIVLIRIPVLAGVFQPEPPIRRGTYATDARTDACIHNLWRQSAIRRQGKPPDPTLVCPAGNRACRVMENGGNTIVMCPEPERHGLSELRVEKNRPAPKVKR